MSSAAIPPPPPYVNPRPGVLKTLGICNLVLAILGMLCVGYSAMMFLAIATGPVEKAEVKVVLPGAAPARGAGVPTVAAFNPFVSLQDGDFMRFSLVDGVVGMLINGLMFATGIGMLNLKGWAVRWWWHGSWARIVLAVLIWGYFIVAVAPGYSERLGRDVAAMIAPRGPAAAGAQVATLTRVYSIMNLITALGAMVFTSIYPAICLWALSRPGVRAAIVDRPTLEPELP